MCLNIMLIIIIDGESMIMILMNLLKFMNIKVYSVFNSYPYDIDNNGDDDYET